MKFTPEVVAALATLREHAENDFERHRIDVLERDLDAPPVAEVIDDNHQKFLNFPCHKDRSGHYRVTLQLHRFVWFYHHGIIPDACEIHHVDQNPANNTIDNLKCLTKSEHQSLHKHNKKCFNRNQKRICPVCGKEFLTCTAGRKKYCSPACRRQYENTRNMMTKKCLYCGKDFQTYLERVKFCSHICSQKFHCQDHIHSTAKLTKEEAEWCRAVYKPYDKEYGACALGRKFGVSDSAIRQILTGKCYKR